ncbi:MAG: ATP-binding protein [Pyrinomonadaceae bacterium]
MTPPNDDDDKKSRAQLVSELVRLRAALASSSRSSMTDGDAATMLRERVGDDPNITGNERLRLILDAVPTPISYVDTEQRYRFNNKAYEAWLGLPVSEIYGKHMSEVLGASVYERVSEFIEAALSGNEMRFERELIYPDKTTRYVSVAFSPDFDAGGRVRGFIITVKDLSERKYAEDALHKAEHRALKEYERLLHRLTQLAESLATADDHLTIFRDLRDFAVVSVPCVGIFISLYDVERDVRTAVYAWGDDVEVDVSQLPAMPITANGPNSRAVRSGQVVITDDYMKTQTSGNAVIIGPDNGLRPQSSLVVPMMLMGHVVGTVEVQSYELAAYRAEHVTAMRMAANLSAVALENMRLFEHETRARAAAEESNRLKDEFLATLSHELRTPLTAILGWSNMLRTGRLDEAGGKSAVEIIERNARTQQQIVNDILDVSRIITGNLRFDAQPTDLHTVVESALDTVRPAAEAKSLRLSVSFETHIGPVLGDASRLQQIVWNLLSNAVKFTPLGGEVRVEVGSAGGHARIEVTDTGLGIPAAFLPYVFDRFRQGDQSRTRAFGGLGLGLAIVRHLVELHGGTAHASSEGEGRGATFVVELPLMPTFIATDDALPADEKGGVSGRGASSSILHGLRVLVVDDEPDTLDLISLILRQHGAVVTPASSAAEAFEAFEHARPDVLLSDIGMPVEDGYSLLRRLHALDADGDGSVVSIPAVALTAYAGEADRAQAAAAGFQLHVPKPIDASQLVAAIAGLTRRK